MKKLLLMVSCFLCGCATGINHNIAVLDGKTYLVETQNFVLPILPVYQWSNPSTFTELTVPAEAPALSGASVISEEQKELLLDIIRSCAKQYPRKALDREKCIRREMNSL